MSNLFASADIERCRSLDHSFSVVGSDKTPMKRSLLCHTCTEQSGVSTYVAYGVDTAVNFGAWRRRRDETEIE